MKTITICEPYATLISRGIKRVENRTWPTSYRGPLAIHAGKSRDWLDLNDDGTADEEYGIPLSEMAFCCVVAVAELVACLHIDIIRGGMFDAAYPWLREHEHTEGPWCLVLENVVRLPEPIPAKGAQGLWNWEPPHIATMVEGGAT